MNMISLEYIAGLVDGEASLGILHHRGKYDTLRPYLRITICNKEVLDLVQETLGTGQLYTESRASKGGLTSYALVIEGKQKLLAVLPQLMPFLIVKKPHAVLVYEFCLNRREYYPYTEAEWTLYYKQLTLQQKHSGHTIQLANQLSG